MTSPTLLASDFDFDLPETLIAQMPASQRSASRLLVLDGSDAEPLDSRITALPDWLRAGDLLIMNDTRVYPARLFGHKDSGGKVELLVERVLDVDRALCMIRASKAPRVGSGLKFEQGAARIEAREADFYDVRFELPVALYDYLDTYGKLPLPPYIDRVPETSDHERYQTVYARETGAVAAPTAGLHFDQPLLHACREAGVASAFLTLHVGAGTFQPVRQNQLDQHIMHAERLQVSRELCEQILQTRSEGGRVVAVGTTVVRALETAAASGRLMPFDGETRLFLKPGDPFHVVDIMLTNFHLPKSTLLMLVSAFAGRQRVLDAYRQAVQRQYRFFSYGDAMLVFPHDGKRS